MWVPSLGSVQIQIGQDGIRQPKTTIEDNQSLSVIHWSGRHHGKKGKNVTILKNGPYVKATSMIKARGLALSD